MNHARVVPAKMTRWNPDLETNVSRVIGYRVKEDGVYAGKIRSTRQDAAADLAAYKSEHPNAAQQGEDAQATGAAEASAGA